jgi:hypothetical protein
LLAPKVAFSPIKIGYCCGSEAALAMKSSMLSTADIHSVPRSLARGVELGTEQHWRPLIVLKFPAHAIKFNISVRDAVGAHHLSLVRKGLASPGAGAADSEEAKRKEFLKKLERGTAVAPS